MGASSAILKACCPLDKQHIVSFPAATVHQNCRIILYLNRNSVHSTVLYIIYVMNCAELPLSTRSIPLMLYMYISIQELL